jgi:hypothetical protein
MREAQAISVPAGETRVLKHFQERMPYDSTLDGLPAALPGVMQHPDALSQGDARRWAARHGRPGRFGYLEVVNASEVLDNAIAGVPDVHAEGEVRLGLHGGQVLLDWPAPRVIYTPLPST